MPIKRTIQAFCDITGTKVNCAPNDVAEDERDADPEVPPGWVVLVGRRVVANPEYIAAEKAREDWITAQRAFIAEAPSDQREALMEQIEEQAPDHDEAPYIVQTVEIVLSPGEVDKAMKRLGVESWE